MTKQEQKGFLNDLINNVRAEILKTAEQIPEEWDGIELRWLIAEKFNGVVFSGWSDKRNGRYKNYANEMLVENL